MIGREKGVKIKGFYVQARETIYRIVAPADSPIQGVAHLRGKTIGVPALASGSVPFSKALVASVGIDPKGPRDPRGGRGRPGTPGAAAEAGGRARAVGHPAGLDQNSGFATPAARLADGAERCWGRPSRPGTT